MASPTTRAKQQVRVYFDSPATERIRFDPKAPVNRAADHSAGKIWYAQAEEGYASSQRKDKRESRAKA